MNVSRESLQVLRKSFLSVRDVQMLRDDSQEKVNQHFPEEITGEQVESIETDYSYIVLAEDLRRAKNYTDDLSLAMNPKRAAEATKAMRKLETWVIRFLQDTEEIATLNLESLPSYIVFSFGTFGGNLERLLAQLEYFYSKN
jgi:hypothetical protein